MKTTKKIAITAFVAVLLSIVYYLFISRTGENNGVVYKWEYKGTPGRVDGHVTCAAGSIPSSFRVIWIETDSGELEVKLSEDGYFSIISGERNLNEIGLGTSSLKRYIPCSKGIWFDIHIK